TRVNQARHDEAALHFDHRLRFHDVDNDQLIAYSKTTPNHASVVIVVVNVDPFNVQQGWVTISAEELGVGTDEPFEVHDLLADARWTWRGPRNWVRLEPVAMPAHLFVVRRR